MQGACPCIGHLHSQSWLKYGKIFSLYLLCRPYVPLLHLWLILLCQISSIHIGATSRPCGEKPQILHS